MNPEKILTILSQIRTFRNVARPLWMDAGFDSETAHFYEGLRRDATCDAELRAMPSRSRVQFRQIYVAAQAWLDTHEPVALQRAVLCAESVLKNYRTPDGGFCYSKTLQNEPSDTRCGAYEQAFAIFAFAHLAHVSHDVSYMNYAEETWQFLLTHLSHPKGGFYPMFPVKNPDAPREQNHHMHLFEASLYAYLFSGEMVWLERANQLFNLFETVFYDPEKGVVRELESSESHSEPGHSAEWIWLLSIYSQISGVQSEPIVRQLYAVLLKNLDPENGCVYDRLDAQNNPTMLGQRLWGQCELLKAHLSMMSVLGDLKAGTRGLNLAEVILLRYLQPNGTWHEHFDATGKDLYSYAPASSFYHINLAFQETFRLLELRLEQKCKGCAGCGGGTCHEA